MKRMSNFKSHLNSTTLKCPDPNRMVFIPKWKNTLMACLRLLRNKSGRGNPCWFDTFKTHWLFHPSFVNQNKQWQCSHYSLEVIIVRCMIFSMKLLVRLISLFLQYKHPKRWILWCHSSYNHPWCYWLPSWFPLFSGKTLLKKSK